MVIAVAQRHALDAGCLRRQYITARIADEQGLRGRDVGHFHDEKQRGRIGLFLWQGVATDDPLEIPADLHLIQQRRDKALRLVGDQRHLHSLFVQPFQGVTHTGIDHGQLVAFAVSLHEDLQRLLSLGVVDHRMFDTTGQRPSHQHRGAIADPLTHRFDAGRLTPEFEQHVIHSRRKVGDRIDQRAIQIEHHQTRQTPREQLLKATHGRASASSERILSMTS
ncbi:hypothetical protein D3C87_1470440 [compost metagenome]